MTAHARRLMAGWFVRWGPNLLYGKRFDSEEEARAVVTNDDRLYVRPHNGAELREVSL